jgi:hypothetical protein
MKALICYNVSRYYVEDQDTSHFLNFAKHLLDTACPETCGALALFFAGYDEDSRSLYEIPEIRSWVQAVDTAWPYIGYFGSTLPGAETLQLFGYSNIDIICYRDETTKQVGVAFDIPTFLQGSGTDRPGWLMKRMLLMNHMAENAFGNSVLDEHGNDTPAMKQREAFIYRRTYEMFDAFNLAKHSGLTPPAPTP